MEISSLSVAPRRLSKPRTNKSSSNLLSEQPTMPSSPHKFFDQDYFNQDAVVVDSHGQRRSRSKSRSRIRAYLYGSSHDVLQTSSDDDDTHTGIANAARDVKKRLSRRASSVTSLHAAKASATRLSNSSSSGLLSTHSTESQVVDPEESAMVADQIKQRAYHDSVAAQNHVSTPADEDKHVDSIMAPLRRKSLYTPGIATRSASDILRKPPKPLMDQDYYYDPSRPETSPLSNLAALSIGEDGRSTPCDLHYSQLGGLELGTLRVTNGSPVLGDYPLRSTSPESKLYDEYYTASEGSVTGDGKHNTRLPPRGESPLKYESQIEDSMRTENQISKSPNCSPFERKPSNESSAFGEEEADHTNQLQWKTTSSDISRLKAEISKGSCPFQKELSKSCLTEATEPSDIHIVEDRAAVNSTSFENKSRDVMKHLEGGNSKVSRPIIMVTPKSYNVDRETLGGSFASKSEIPNEIVKVEGTSSNAVISVTRSLASSFVEGKRPIECFPFREKTTKGALDVASTCNAEFEGSPYSFSSLEDNKDINSPSQELAKETWRPVSNDDRIPHIGNSNGSREDAFRKLTANDNISTVLKPEPLSLPNLQPSRHSAPSEAPLASSGYYTHAILAAAPVDPVYFKFEGDPISTTKSMAPPQPQTVETNRSSARSPFRLPTRKLKKQRPKSQPPPVNPMTEYHELSNANIPRIPSILAAKHANRLCQFPLLEHTFPSPQHTTANDALSQVTAYDKPIHFPFPANALETASPTLEPFSTASSNPRASALIVDEDDWGTSDLVRSPSWSEFGRGRRKKGQKKLVKDEKERGIEKGLLKEEGSERRLQQDRKELERQNRKDDNKQKSTCLSAASRTIARSSEGQNRHDTEMAIADFGTVIESLGNNPYDIARPTYSNPQTARNLSPNHIRTARSRPNISFGAVSHSQSMFLDMPSVPALAAVDLKAHNLEWVRNQQRSQNCSAPRAESNDHAHILREVIRPHSVAMDVSPRVPAILPANQVQRREVETIGSPMTVEMPKLNTSLCDTGEQAVTTYSSVSDTTATSRQRKDSKIVPTLWSNGSLERMNPKTVERSGQTSNSLIYENDNVVTSKDSVWNTYSDAWSQRRKSASEALLRDRVRDIFDSQGANSALPRASTSGGYQTSIPTPSYLQHFPNPLASHTAQQPNSAPNVLGSHCNQSSIQQAQRDCCSPLASPFRPSASSLQHGSHSITSDPSRARIQPFQIQRKRVGSGPSFIRAKAECVLV